MFLVLSQEVKSLSHSHSLFIPASPGVLRVWEASSARCVFTQTLPVADTEGGEEEDADPRSLTYCLPLPNSSSLATVTAEHNILLYQLPTLTTRQQVGQWGKGELQL